MKQMRQWNEAPTSEAPNTSILFKEKKRNKQLLRNCGGPITSSFWRGAQPTTKEEWIGRRELTQKKTLIEQEVNELKQVK